METKDNVIFSGYKEPIQEAIEDIKTKGRRHKQIPNILTLMRLTAPFFIIPSAIIGSTPLVIGLTVIFGLTDLVDGFIARTWNLTSELGAALDAVTDKVFTSTLLLAASVTNPILLMNLALEGAIAGINVYKKLNNQPLKSTFIGKVKTWFLFALAGLGIISPSLDVASIFDKLVLTTAFMQMLTFDSYLNTALAWKKTGLLKDETMSLTVPNDDDENELVKEKDFDSDVITSKIEQIPQIETTNPKEKVTDNASLKQLKVMREYLVAENEYLNKEEDKNIETKSKMKTKTDDFDKL